MMNEMPNGSLDVLRCKIQDQISMPVEIELEDGMLKWVAYDSPRIIISDKEMWRSCPFEGAFQGFLALADAGATDQDAWEFAQKWGVLGLFPFVEFGWAGDNNDWALIGRYLYKEPTIVYGILASQFAAILRLMTSLKNGYPVDSQDLTIATNPVSLRPPTNFGHPSGVGSLMYWLVQLTVSELWKSASLRMSLDSFQSSDTGLSLPTRPHLGLEFGDWWTGHAWDAPMARRTRPGDRIAASSSQERAVTNRDEDASRHTRETLQAEGYEKNCKEEWSRSYMQSIGYSLEPLNAKEMRPSALFNALVFHLLKEVTLPDGSYSCSQCNRIYTYDEKNKKPKDTLARRELSAWGNSKPRRGRPTSFCSEFCRIAFDAADNKRRYHERNRHGSLITATQASGSEDGI